jgi:AcrR family transcriptional regulator
VYSQLVRSKKIAKRPYSSEKRRAASQATREKIVSAAVRRLRERGFAEFSVEAVANAAKVTRLTVYNQFGDRKALLEAVFDAEARRGGLSRVAEAMALDDPHLALPRIVEAFCEFWTSSGALRAVLAAAMADAELAGAIATRNERRRQLLNVLVERFVERSVVNRVRADGLVDTLFALTSFSFYSELSRSRLSRSDVARTIVALAEAAVQQSRNKRS